jgi:hypothetical protein
MLASLTTFDNSRSGCLSSPLLNTYLPRNQHPTHEFLVELPSEDCVTVIKLCLLCRKVNERDGRDAYSAQPLDWINIEHVPLGAHLSFSHHHVV